MLKTSIKAGSITNLTDARYFAAWEVEWLGFNLEPDSPDFILPIEMKAIREWVEGPKIVGEFHSSSVETIQEAIIQLSLDAIQCAMEMDEASLQKIKDVAIIKEIVVKDEDEAIDLIEYHINKYSPYVDIFLIDFEKNGISSQELSTETIDFLKQICAAHTIIFAISIPSNEVLSFLDTVQAKGLHLKGGAEEKVGFKSYDELDEIFEVLEILV